ncbi:hypothetical protein FRZ67_13210 [Panacibacter ginsenosidivorans]|uniref:Uncharacterized protein n=1 Tax=Panacibacter ginsenosidivorans TaxID=1813871 RepID=A0A5B8VB51_9BACT|nr:hypothetical protein [Panacibacter ginsenosidivorans]QEC68213.1 hypothetical protein FRZ67_13210 [Panacibacter ginsenosidivorans]
MKQVLEVPSLVEIRTLKKQTYTVPQDYFQGLANNILIRIDSIQREKHSEVFDELVHVTPLLNTISKRNILSVPDDYFDNLKVKPFGENKEPKVILMSATTTVRKWMTYAAAASVLFILSTASYAYINHHLKGIDKSLTIGQRMATLKDEEIINYLQNDLGDFDPNTATSTDNDPDINHMLINASDAEIERYLDTESDSGEEIIKGI